MSKIAFIGTGAWATALANVALKNKHQVLMYGIDNQEINDLELQKNSKYFGNERLFKKPHFLTSNIKDIANFNPDVVVLAVPSSNLENVTKNVIDVLKNKPIFVNVAKGLDPKTNQVWSYSLSSIIKTKSKGLVTIIGPSFAEEVFKNYPTIVNAIGHDSKIIKEIIKIFNNNVFRVIENNDEIGAQYMSALKNVVAIGLGISYKLHTSINTRAALLAQATKEVMTIAKTFGGKYETLAEFCGIGDIYLTCTDQKSRNFSFGNLIAKNGLKKTNITIEGISSAKIVHQIINSCSINAPFLETTYMVLYKNFDPKNFVKKIFKNIKS